MTPAGPDAESTWDGLLDGRPTAARDDLLAGLPVDFSCRVAGLGPRLRRTRGGAGAADGGGGGP